jgi:hypothetical protein
MFRVAVGGFFIVIVLYTSINGFKTCCFGKKLQNLKGKRKAFQENRKAYRNSHNLTGKRKNLREFAFPSGKS